MAARRQRRWVIGIALFAAAVGCIAFSFGRGNKIPYYEGKSLQEWFDSLAPPAMYSEDDTNVLAIVAIGSDAVPFLMREFSISDSPWPERFRWLWSEVGFQRTVLPLPIFEHALVLVRAEDETEGHVLFVGLEHVEQLHRLLRSHPDHFGALLLGVVFVLVLRLLLIG